MSAFLSRKEIGDALRLMDQGVPVGDDTVRLALLELAELHGVDRSPTNNVAAGEAMGREVAAHYSKQPVEVKSFEAVPLVNGSAPK